jgi:hypothetical protein
VGGDRADEVCLAEDEERLDLEPADPLEQLLLRVGLPQHLLLDALDGDTAAVALGLDGVDAAGADDDVVDVAAAEVDVVEDVPVGAEPFERRADLALARRPARPAFGRRPGRGGADDDHEERDQLDLDQRQPMAAEGEEGDPRDG